MPVPKRRVTRVERYFTSHDGDNPFTRLKYATPIGFGVGGVAAAIFVPVVHLEHNNKMKSALLTGRFLGYGVAAAAAHSATINILSSFNGHKDDVRHHTVAGFVTGAILSIPRNRGFTAALAYGTAGAMLSYFLRQTAVGSGRIEPGRDLENETGIRNYRMSFSLRHRFMNPNWKAQEEALENNF